VSDNPELLVDQYFSAWNAHDGPRLAALFADSGTYQDPMTRMAIHPCDLQSVIEALAEQISDLAFEIGNINGERG
jgi:hypothetical protein